MLPKILELDGRVSEVARRLGLCCPPESPAVLAPSNKKVRRALAFGGAEAAETAGEGGSGSSAAGADGCGGAASEAASCSVSEKSGHALHAPASI